jgi:hypothetical protein
MRRSLQLLADAGLFGDGTDLVGGVALDDLAAAPERKVRCWTSSALEARPPP